MRGRNLHRQFAFLAATSLAMAIAGRAYAIPAYTGGNGGISFGVSSYGGAPNIGGPTFIPNNFTGLNDILSSPGLGTLGGYLTANPDLPERRFNCALERARQLAHCQRRRIVPGLDVG